MKFVALMVLLVVLVLVRVQKDPPMASNLLESDETGSVRINTNSITLTFLLHSKMLYNKNMSVIDCFHL